jgi:Zn-dependent M16 (insulinase) family peptidase
MAKQIIRLTESDLHRIVKNSVKKVIKESYYEDRENVDEIIKQTYDNIDTLKSIMYQERNGGDEELARKISGFFDSIANNSYLSHDYIGDEEEEWDEFEKPYRDMEKKANFDWNTHPQTDRRVAATQYAHPDSPKAEWLAQGRF